MTKENGTSGPLAPAAWVAFLPTLAALAAFLVYGFLLAFPSTSRPPVLLMAPCAAAAFALFQLTFPACRPAPRYLISPLNWALLAFFVQLVVMPMTISWVDPDAGTLPYVASRHAINHSIVLSIVAFAAFSLGYTIFIRRGRSPPPPRALSVPNWVLLLYAAIGLVGLFLRFGSAGELIATLAEPARFADLDAAENGTLRGAASTFFRPFLLNAIVIAWCRWVDRRGANASRVVRLTLTAVAGVAVVVVGASYGFNRASFVVPLLAMTAAYSVHARRLSLRSLALAGLLAAPLALVPALYRSNDMTAGEWMRSGGDVMRSTNAGTEFQTYCGAPQFTGFLLEAAERSHEHFTPVILLGSILTPVPIVGKAFRDDNGSAVYNRLIYGNTGIADQIIPFEGEVYLCLGFAGLFAAYVAMGFIIGWLERRFNSAATAFDSYALQFVAAWVAFLVQGSLASASQVFIFFLWPIYGYALLRRVTRTTRERVAGSNEATSPDGLSHA